MEQREKTLLWSIVSIAVTLLLLMIGCFVSIQEPYLRLLMWVFLMLGGALAFFVAATVPLSTMTSAAFGLYLLELLLLYVEFIVALIIGNYGKNATWWDIGIHIGVLTVSYAVFFLIGLKMMNLKCYTKTNKS